MHITTASIGFITGLLYGLSFVLQQRRVFTLGNTQKIIPITFLLATRLLILGTFGHYLLRSATTAPILVSMFFFFVGFWLIIFNKRAFSNERS